VSRGASSKPEILQQLQNHKAARVYIENGPRFGLHNLRHSLGDWLVNKAKIEPKTVQRILRHARIQTTLDLYTQDDSDETLAARCRISDGAGSGYVAGAVKCGLECGLRFLGQHPVSREK
jgi:hypothetical protein